MNYSKLKAVTADSQQWHVKVRVVRFSEHLSTDDPPKILNLCFVMLDEEGTGMEAVIPGKWIDRYRPQLIEDHVYYIRSFQVDSARLCYRPVEHDYMARFTVHTRVNEVRGVPDSFPLYACTIAPFSVLEARVGKTIFMSDALGILTKCGHAQMKNTKAGTRALRNVHITDGSETIVVSLWGPHAEEFQAEEYMERARRGPLALLFVGVTASHYLGRLTLQASATCRWYANPALPAAVALQDRCASIVRQPEWIGVPTAQAGPVQTTIATLAAIEDPHDVYGNRYSVTAKIKKLMHEEMWWYMGCTTCNRTSVPYGEAYKCTNNYCSGTSAKPRFRLTMAAADPASPDTDDEPVIEVVAFGPIGEELTGITAEALVNATAGGEDHIPREITRLFGRRYDLLITVPKSSLQRIRPSFRIETARAAIEPPPPESTGPSNTASASGVSSQAEHIAAVACPTTPVKDVLDDPTREASAHTTGDQLTVPPGQSDLGEPFGDLEDTDLESGGSEPKRARKGKRLILHSALEDD